MSDVITAIGLIIGLWLVALGVIVLAKGTDHRLDALDQRITALEAGSGE